MIKKSKLYDAFGELLYAIAIADGEVQQEEIEALEKLLKEHPWAKEIKWSFDYEKEKSHSLEEAYSKAIDICKENGPDPEYKYLLDVMIKVADAFDGIIPQEKKVIDSFVNDLKERFIHDLEANKLANFDDE
jgi:uncharacterized tellurite resistance protein B-like protein